MNRFVSIVLAAWCLFVGPNLCLAGIVGHTCECEPCCPDCPTSPSPPDKACPDDPCRLVLADRLPARALPSLSPEIPVAPVAILAGVDILCPPDVQSDAVRFGALAPPGGPRSDWPMPLLI